MNPKDIPPDLLRRAEAARRKVAADDAARRDKMRAAFEQGASDRYTQADFEHDLRVTGARNVGPQYVYVQQQDDDIQEAEEYPATVSLGEITHSPVRDTMPSELREAPIEDAVIIEDGPDPRRTNE